MEDIVRVLRVLEYVGERSAVEDAIKNSIQGDMKCTGYTIRSATVGTFPEILDKGEERKDG